MTQVPNSAKGGSSPSLLTTEQSPVLVFFDGQCGFCDMWVNQVLQQDQQGLIRFSPKQGSTFSQAAMIFPEVAKVDSIVVIDRDENGRERAAVRSVAISRVLAKLPSNVFLKTLLAVMPTFLANIGYWIVSKLRYYIFGRLNTCRIPKPEERARFLD
jgi:predicted DCC family thiol-disulfide oxidoreductase YuxK